MPTDPRTIAELAHALRGREVTAAEITERCLSAIAERNTTLNAFITVLSDKAREQARRADAELAAGQDRGLLHGVPISIKDLIDIEGTATTAASRVRVDHRARADSTVLARLREAGAVLIGKTNLHEFALGTTNEDSAFGPARHPFDTSRSPGGSSGGSAVSVVADMCFGSIGTDTGGSIRIPSAACGLVGLKPSIGEIPMDGVFPLSATLDHVGPICRSVEDAAIVYSTLRAGPYQSALPAAGTRPLRFGVLRGYFTAKIDAHIESQIEATYERLKSAGVELRDTRVQHASDISNVYSFIAIPEAALHHTKTLEDRPGDYTENVRLRLESGRYILAEDYLRAMRGRGVLIHEVDEAMEDLDGLLLPAMPIPATTIGVPTVRVGESEEQVRAMTLRLTQLFNVTGHPAITIPCGLTPDGFPAGLQMVGHRDQTAALLGVARRLEPVIDTQSIARGGRRPSAAASAR
ncbi:MAG: amidase [Acidobacteria bacterium]|nr:amidase [Acidobacteriota bacterium]